TLVNGSLLVRASSSDGTVTVPLIPLGKFNATISLLGASTQVVGDVSNLATVQGTVPLSYPILGIAGVVAAVVVVAVLLLRRRGVAKP
ncbi:MAG: hypothetical protein HYZ12_02030, partial [Thaumarchaeota archaeon]|nr:hypothetical protein [Nitrososphaerota archaeon]